MQTIKVERKDDYAIVQLNRGKVNAINHQMVQEIRRAFDDLETDSSVKGVIITGTPHFFTAGLDVIELYGYDKPKMNEFFNDFGGMYIQLAKFSKPFICAITGYSPAGGCVIAITADHRIMAAGEKYTIGLNEVAVNIQISNNLIRGYSYWLGEGKANECILGGKLLSVDEALDTGLVNEVCDLEEVLPKAEAKMKQYLQADEEIFKNTKYKLRRDWLESMEEDPKVDLEQAISLWWKPEIRAKMKAFVESLQKK
ncbi:enoyl-CoA hydratase/isomerase family protein [Aquimarina sp. AD1]|uniref:enoyl-CoA hydratase/isomerase family protein n=1 Tax=Aquimarina sp. (strain AD1) TaxID=1714848 RepID=UPI000E50F27D|nr:enoyl-CoA hydratase/isomerase family protein [Aquimarina sp. AD1]AXT55501.1 enoyl-CoA hydratase/isomerase family protein [Aquimarina sp. AD1]RKN36009.1 enoyl-CoA hydratase/isomerase family protein [Aquimarina sp. AD1]